MGWCPPAPISREDEELAAWEELQEEGGGPEALAGVEEKQAGPSRPFYHPAQPRT